MPLNDRVGHRSQSRRLGRPAPLRLMTATSHQDVVATDVPLHPWTLAFGQSSPHPITRVLQAYRLHVFCGILRSAACSFPPQAFATRSAGDPKAFFGAFPIWDGDRWMGDTAHGQMEAIRHLYRVRRSGADRAAVIGRAIASDELYTRVFQEPRSSRFGSSVREQVDNPMALAVSEDGAEDLAFAKGNVIDTEHARRCHDGKGSGMHPPEQCIPARRHGASRALARTRLATKGQGKITKCRIQTDRALGGWEHQIGKALGEGDGRAGSIDAAKASSMEKQTSDTTTDRKVSRVPDVITVDPRGVGGTARTSCGPGFWRHREQEIFWLDLDVQHPHIWHKRCQQLLSCRRARNKCTHPRSIAHASASSRSTGDADEPISREVMR